MFRTAKIQRKFQKGTPFEVYAPLFRQAYFDLAMANAETETESIDQMASRADTLVKSSEKLEAVRPADGDLLDVHVRLVGLCRAFVLELKHTFVAFQLNPYVHPEQARKYRHAMSEADAWHDMRIKASSQFADDVDRLEAKNPNLFRKLDLENLLESLAAEQQHLSGQQTVRADDI